MDYKEAAKRLDISVPGVYKALNEGRLEGSKAADGRWEISMEAILKFQGKYEAEADLFKAEWVIKKHFAEKEMDTLNKIYGFCKNYVEVYSTENYENAHMWAKKVAEQVDQLDQLQQARELIGEAIMENLSPLEETYEEDENE